MRGNSSNGLNSGRSGNRSTQGDYFDRIVNAVLRFCVVSAIVNLLLLTIYSNYNEFMWRGRCEGLAWAEILWWPFAATLLPLSLLAPFGWYVLIRKPSPNGVYLAMITTVAAYGLISAVSQSVAMGDPCAVHTGVPF